MTGVWRRLAALVTAALVAGACSGDDGTSATGQREQPAATTTTTTTAVPVAGVPGQPGAGRCPPVPERAAPHPDRPRYDVRVDVSPATNTVSGRLSVRFSPDMGTDRLVFRLWPNAPRTARAGARLTPGAVSVGGRPVPSSVENPTTLVARPGPLAANRPVDVALDWRLTLPGPAQDRLSRRGDAIRLGSFFPILAWEPGVGWATEPPTTGFAEASTAPAADFTATISVPAGLDVLATGTAQGDGRWTATAVPDFAVSVGRFSTASATVNVPHPVVVTVGMHSGLPDAPTRYLSRVTRALEDLSRRYGSYPWSSFSMAVTPDLDGGLEYPMHVLQGPGTDDGTTAHEVAHMWFYALVGNDQGRDPWLDEGLATWGEARVEGTLASYLSRPIPPAGQGRAGEPMAFWESRRDAYYRSVYVQPVQALAALGPADLVDCALRLYVARTAYRIARARDLMEALTAVFPDARAKLARFGIR